MTLREKLIQLRDKAGVSQLTLADELGVTRQTVSRWESGRTVPSEKALQALAENYQVSVAWLSGEDEFETKSQELQSCENCESSPKQQPCEGCVFAQKVQRSRTKRKWVMILAAVFALALFLGVLKWVQERPVPIGDLPTKSIEPEREEGFEFSW